MLIFHRALVEDDRRDSVLVRRRRVIRSEVVVLTLELVFRRLLVHQVLVMQFAVLLELVLEARVDLRVLGESFVQVRFYLDSAVAQVLVVSGASCDPTSGAISVQDCRRGRRCRIGFLQEEIRQLVQLLLRFLEQGGVLEPARNGGIVDYDRGVVAQVKSAGVEPETRVQVVLHSALVRVDQLIRLGRFVLFEQVISQSPRRGFFLERLLELELLELLDLLAVRVEPENVTDLREPLADLLLELGDYLSERLLVRAEALELLEVLLDVLQVVPDLLPEVSVVLHHRPLYQVFEERGNFHLVFLADLLPVIDDILPLKNFYFFPQLLEVLVLLLVQVVDLLLEF